MALSSGSSTGGRHCYVVGCTNGDYGLNKWKKELCALHGVLHGTKPCDCTPPFELFPFPTKRFDPIKREQWLKILSRADPAKPHTLLEPAKGHRVCSKHFIDAKPTLEHPDPEIALGHSKTTLKRHTEREERTVKRARLGGPVPGTSTRQPSLPPAAASSPSEQQKPSCPLEQPPPDQPTPPSQPATPELETSPDAPSPLPPPQLSQRILNLASRFIIFVLLSVVRSQRSYIDLLKKDNEELAQRVQELKKSKAILISEQLLKSDENVLFYTGIPNRSVFHKLHDFVSKYVKRRWRGKRSYVYSKIRKFKKSPHKLGPPRLLHSKDEFLLTLMRIRLGCLTKDLADRFAISKSLASQIFQSWITAMSKVLSELTFWPSKDAVHETKPKRFSKTPGLRAIIDCSEVFLETPKDLKLQSVTWSDYKHHNTGKFLIGVAPNSAITFVSNVFGGRASDKAITLESKFLDLMDPHDLLQADKGFNIQDECSSRMIMLQVPPGKRGEAQMSTAAVKKTSRIANLRILVEQVIRRLKTFRILKYEIPVTMIPTLDKIVKVCAALCNLRQPIYKT